jgi:hypothetical protein
MQTSTIPIWEEKGIIIGLFAHIIKHYTYLINKTIIINNNLYGSIIKLFFDDLILKKHKKTHHKNVYFINIKNVIQTEHVHINNLNNFQIIHNKRIILLPWYDKDNPIIMFTYDEKQTANMPQLIDDLTYFEKHIRFTKFNSPGRTKTNCIIDCWDTYYERKILKKFVKLYPEYNVNQVNETINKILLYPTCSNNPKYIQHIQPVQPVQTIKYVEVPKYIKNECKPEIKEVIKYVKEDYKPQIKEVQVTKWLPAPIPIPLPISKSTCKVNDDLVKLITNKTKAMNYVLNHDFTDLDEQIISKEKEEI